MHIRRIAILAVAMIGIIAGVVAATAGADDFQADDTTVDLAPAATQLVTVTLVAVDDTTNPNDNEGCNLQVHAGDNAHFVDASVTSSDTSVATVDPDSLHFDDCGDTDSFTITAVACGTAQITVHAEDWQAERGPNAVFSDEVINVTVSGDCNGGGGDITSCAKPAAPAWAAAILKANGVKPKQADNLISLVAQHMTQGATFDGVAKSDQEAYAEAVYAFLQAKKSGLTIGPAGAAKPGWVCTTTPA
jgi:hypothetical protein